MALTKKQVKQLRGLATKLNPLIQVGKNDLSENAIKQADETIEKRELIKCSVLDGSGLTAKEAGEGLAEELNAELVQVIGNRFVLYRRSHRDDVEHIRLVREYSGKLTRPNITGRVLSENQSEDTRLAAMKINNRKSGNPMKECYQRA